jgi:hypothetical protein
MDASFKQIPMAELRVKLPKLRRQVQLGNLRFVVTHYGEVAAYVLPLADIDGVLDEEGKPIVKQWEEMPLTKFRDELTHAWESLLAGTDCVYLTFHNRRVVAFVSSRLTQHLSLPIIGNPDQILFLSSESKSFIP